MILRVVGRHLFSVNFRFIIYQSTLLSFQSPHHEGVWRMEVEPLSFLTLALEDAGGSPFRPNRFTPDKEPQYPLGRRSGRIKSQRGRFSKGENLSPLPRFEHRNFQHFASRYAPPPAPYS